MRPGQASGFKHLRKQSQQRVQYTIGWVCHATNTHHAMMLHNSLHIVTTLRTLRFASFNNSELCTNTTWRCMSIVIAEPNVMSNHLDARDLSNLCICTLCGAECQKSAAGVMLAPPMHSALGTQMSHVLLRGSSEK
jgi:hypothetical protein